MTEDEQIAVLKQDVAELRVVAAELREELAARLPSEDELVDALEAPGPLRDQPAIQALLAAREPRPRLTLVAGGGES